MGLKKVLRGLVYGSLLPSELARRQRMLSEGQREQVDAALRRHYFSQPINYFAASADAYLESPEGAQDLRNEAEGRLAHDRERVIPWLNAARPLSGLRVLEVGCGTGASTVALAEQGATVTGIDVLEGNIAAADERLRVHGLEAQLRVANASELHTIYRAGEFDLIIFFAVLEHMTHRERLGSLKGSWSLLNPGGLLAVVETPNRLWWFDDHTAELPFYHWLPDDLAFEYSPHSERSFMKNYPGDRSEATRLDFARRGRGASYHEFELALGRFEVVSALEPYLQEQSLPLRVNALRSRHRSFERMLRKLGPPIHRGFYQRYLDLILRK
jgi:2-polyprenyl-3-methyl-5-hydroxy-6-metoxy-1,4-benzoquinol methylase